MTEPEQVTEPGQVSRTNPLTGPEHRRRAEELIAEANQAATSGQANAAERYAQNIAEAQVHATLALAAGDDQARPGWYGWLVLLFAGLFAGVSIFAYDGLNHWYRPVVLAAATNNLGALQNVTMGGTSRSQAAWSQQGYTRQLEVNGPGQGTAEVILPVPASKCPEMAGMLGTQCLHGRQLQIANPVTFTWSRPDSISSSGVQLAPGGLDIAPSLARPADLGVTVAPTANNYQGTEANTPSECFEKPYPAAAVTLTVTVIGNSKPHSYFQYSGPDWQTACAAGVSGAGISVVVDWPDFEFGGISTFALCASAPAGTLQGFAGQVDLTPGSTTVLSGPTTVSLRSRADEPLLAWLDIGINTQLPCTPGQAVPASPACVPVLSSGSLTVCSQAATGVLTNSGQLVESEWTRDSPIIVPLFGGIVTALVVAPLGVSVQALMDALKRFRRRVPTDTLRGSRDRSGDGKSSNANKGNEHAP